MSYVTVTYRNPFLAPVDKLGEIKESLDNFVESMKVFTEKFLYWINPLNWFVELNKGLYWLVHHAETGHYLVAATIIAIWFWMMGVNAPKKWIFWAWVGFWVLRAIVYNF